MPRLIDAEKLWKAITTRIEEYCDIADLIEIIETQPTVDAEPVVRCKDCKYFLYDKLYMVEGLPLMGNLVCDKWGNGCRTDENGYCFMGKRREDADN